MLQELKIDNMKSIKHLTLELDKMNVFIGTNSSGKSTVLQALFLLAQNVDGMQGINGKLVDLGQFDELRCVYSIERDQIKIATKVSDDLKCSLVIDAGMKEGLIHKYKYICTLPECINENVKAAFQKKFDYQNRMIQYISSHRVGPEKVYKKNITLEDTVGNNGEYAFSYLNLHKNDVLEDALCREKSDLTLISQVNYWLDYILNTEIKTEEIKNADLIQVSYSMYEKKNIRPLDIGAGISYLVTILIAALSSPWDSILAIENPEIHLHPSAQSKVCDFLYFISQNHRQVLIETHSDHIFNGFRAGIALGEMDAADINMQFIHLNEGHTTEAMRVKVGQMGRIENQCPDMFDQFDLDMNRMIGLRRRKYGADNK